MKLRALFECFRCFMIGNYNDANSGIDDKLYSEYKPIDVYPRNTAISSIPLYTPPSEDIDDTAIESCEIDSAYSQEDKESVSANKYNEQETKNSTNVFKNMTELIEELDMIKQRLTNDETIQMVTFCQDKIIEGLSSSGAQLIVNDEVYSNYRHRPIPYDIYTDGLPIKRTIRPGVRVKNEVIMKALVEL